MSELCLDIRMRLHFILESAATGRAAHSSSLVALEKWVSHSGVNAYAHYANEVCELECALRNFSPSADINTSEAHVFFTSHALNCDTATFIRLVGARYGFYDMESKRRRCKCAFRSSPTSIQVCSHIKQPPPTLTPKNSHC